MTGAQFQPSLKDRQVLALAYQHKVFLSLDIQSEAYTKPAKKRDCQLPCSLVSCFLAAIVCFFLCVLKTGHYRLNTHGTQDQRSMYPIILALSYHQKIPTISCSIKVPIPKKFRSHLCLQLFSVQNWPLVQRIFSNKIFCFIKSIETDLINI